MKLYSLGLVALSAMAFAASAQAAVPLSNGDFSNPAVSGPNAPLFQTFYASTSDTIGAWKVSSGNVDLIGNYWNGPTPGAASVDLNGFNPGAISQNILGLTPGQHFDVKFSFAGNPAGGQAIKTLLVSLDGGSTQTLTFDTTGHSTNNMGWKSESLAFTATGGSNILKFASGDSDSNSYWGPAIASISIAAPEPATWAMMLIGFGGLGATLRMNRRRAAVAAA
jgi:choice-of-anchor C domain-containing protein